MALNDIINKRKKSNNFPDYFIVEIGTNVITNKSTADQFNRFFVEIGPKLADKIDDVDNKFSILDFMGEGYIYLQCL